MIKLASCTPDSIRELCINFKNKDYPHDFISILKNDSEILHYLDKSEELIQSRIFYTGVNYSEIFNTIFSCDERYINQGVELEKNSGYFCLKYLYIVINYVEDNFPIIAERELTFVEKKFVEFMLYSGNEKDFMNQSSVSKKDLDKIVLNICKTYRCENINTALNFILIEKYMKDANKTFIKVIDVLNG